MGGEVAQHLTLQAAVFDALAEVESEEGQAQLALEVLARRPGAISRRYWNKKAESASTRLRRARGTALRAIEALERFEAANPMLTFGREMDEVLERHQDKL